MLDLVAVSGVAAAFGGVIGAVSTAFLNKQKQKHSEDQDWYKAVQDVQTKFDAFKEQHLVDAVAAATEKEHLRAQAAALQANHVACEEKHQQLEKDFDIITATCKSLQESIEKNAVELRALQELSNATTPGHANRG